MKRVLTFLLALSAFSLLPVTNSCMKDQPNDHLIDVSFNINTIYQQGGLKSDGSNVMNSSGLEADYVRVVINDEEYIINVFYIGEMPYTNTIKLPLGIYNLSEVVVYSDNHNSNSDDDVALAATPHAGSGFARYVQHPLNYAFTVSGTNKLGLPIEVVSYFPGDYKQFGFTYF